MSCLVLPCLDLVSLVSCLSLFLLYWDFYLCSCYPLSPTVILSFFCSVVFTSHSLYSFSLNDIALFVPSLLRRIWTTKNHDVDDDYSTSAPVCACRHTIVDNSNWKLRLKRRNNQHRRTREDHCCLYTSTYANKKKRD